MNVAHPGDAAERSEEEQIAFFDAMLAGWAVADARTQRHALRIDVGGSVVELQFAGDALMKAFAPALAHLAVAPDETEPDAIVHCWDSASTGAPAIPPPCTTTSFTERGDIWGMTSTRVRTAFHWHDFSVSVMDLERRRGVFWVREASALPSWSQASPLRTMFHWWAASRGEQLLHAAAVGDANGAVLIVGRGGTGKSSTALSSVASGMEYVADDYLLVQLDPEPRAWSLYATAKLDPEQMTRFPTLAAHVSPELRGTTGTADKAVLYLWPALASQVVRSLPIRAIVTPAFGDSSETRLEGVSPTVLQRAAAFTTMSQLPGAGRETHAFIQRLVDSVPGFTLRLGSDRARVPDALRTLLADPARAHDLAHDLNPKRQRMHRPVVSVIIPVFNGTRFLERCVRSVLEQDYAPIEILIVDDGSTDDVETVVRSLPVDVRFFRQANAGPAAARNRGIREATGDVIAFVDVDDYWPAGNLATMVDRLAADRSLLAVHGAANVVREDPDGTEVFVAGPPDVFPFYIGAGVYRREAFDVVGLFDPELRFGEDSDWFHRARELGAPVLHVDEIALIVRRHADNMTRGRSVVELSTLRVFKKALDRRRAAKLAGDASLDAPLDAT